MQAKTNAQLRLERAGYQITFSMQSSKIYASKGRITYSDISCTALVRRLLSTNISFTHIKTKAND